MKSNSQKFSCLENFIVYSVVVSINYVELKNADRLLLKMSAIVIKTVIRCNHYSRVVTIKRCGTNNYLIVCM